MIFDARNLRDSLAATVDVTKLGVWLDLNAEYDAALRQLYQAILDSKRHGDPRGQGGVRRRGGGTRTTPGRHEGPGHHPRRDRAGRAQPGGHRHRGGTRPARCGPRADRNPARRGACRSLTEVHSEQIHRRRPGGAPCPREDVCPCSCVSLPTSPGTSRPTSSPSRSSASPRSRAPSTSSTGGPAASCAPSPRSASCGRSATRRRSRRRVRWRPAASSR